MLLRILPFFAALFVFSGMMSAQPGIAAAPTATLTASDLTLTVGQTTPINTITFTDVDPSEVTAANDLWLRITTGMRAAWDTSDTTATFGGTASTSTNTTVSYTAASILKINATERFSPLGTLTIADLSLAGISSSSTALRMDYSIDGGVTYASSSVFVTVNPATLAASLVDPASHAAGAKSTVAIHFTTSTQYTMVSTGKIQVRFPAGFVLSEVGSSDGTCSTMNGTFTTSVAGQVVTLTRAAGTTIQNTQQICAIANVINPGAGTAGTYTLQTQGPAGAPIEQDMAVTASTFTAGALTNVNVEPASLSRSVVGPVDVSFTTAGYLSNGDKIVTTFPSGFDVSGVLSGDGSCQGVTYATSVSGQNVTITIAAAGAAPPAAYTCRINNVRNPSTSGLSGTYSVKTTGATDLTIDAKTDVAGDTFVGGSGGGGGGDVTAPGPVTGASITLGSDALSAVMTWINPTDSDLAGVRVFRSTISGTEGTQIAETLAGSFTDTGLVAGATYYYTFRTFDASGNVNIDPTEYMLTATPGAPPATPITPSTPSSPPAPGSVTFPAGVAASDVVRGSRPAVYFVSSDGTRHVFPNETVFFSWYPDFSVIKTVADAALAALPLGKNVSMRPGTRLVKIISDPKVYAVEPGGTLRWIPSEDAARALYGAAWATRVRDVDATLFADYVEGAVQLVSAPPAGMVASDGAGAFWWIVRDATNLLRRHATLAALSLQHFASSFAVGPLANLPVLGSDITQFEAGLAQPYP